MAVTRPSPQSQFGGPAAGGWGGGNCQNRSSRWPLPSSRDSFPILAVRGAEPAEEMLFV